MKHSLQRCNNQVVRSHAHTQYDNYVFYRSGFETMQILAQTNRLLKLQDHCYRFIDSAALRLRIHPCFYCYPGVIDTEKEDVTMVTQLSMDRVLSLARVLESWTGPASVVFAVTDLTAKKLLQNIEEGILPNKRANVQYHAVYLRGVSFVFPLVILPF